MRSVKRYKSAAQIVSALETKIATLTAAQSRLAQETKSWKVAFESMKCCGNCNHQGCALFPKNMYDYCPQWQSDGLTRKDRRGNEK
jgi:hypothetical protein